MDQGWIFHQRPETSNCHPDDWKWSLAHLGPRLLIFMHPLRRFFSTVVMILSNKDFSNTISLKCHESLHSEWYPIPKKIVLNKWKADNTFILWHLCDRGYVFAHSVPLLALTRSCSYIVAESFSIASLCLLSIFRNLMIDWRLWLDPRRNQLARGHQGNSMVTLSQMQAERKSRNLFLQTMNSIQWRWSNILGSLDTQINESGAHRSTPLPSLQWVWIAITSSCALFFHFRSPRIIWFPWQHKVHPSA